MPNPDPTLPLDADPDVAAAELALGLLEGDDRAAALRRQLADPAFAREVERWREHFGVLFAGTADRAPPAHLAQRIEAHLDRPQFTARAPAVGFWRPLALVSSLAAATLAGVMVVRPVPSPAPIVQPAAPAAQMFAALAHGKEAPMPAIYDQAASTVRLPGPMPIPAGHSAQLWAIPDGGKPIPLGLFRVVGTTIIADAKSAAMMKPGTMLAISLEPVGGSPTGQPTGPVVASGMLTKV